MPQKLPVQTLLHTKLRRPRSVGQIVHRPRLNDLLQRSLSLPLTLVSAPAGYGKSTLVALWLDEIDVPWTWYSIDSHDNSLGEFVVYLAGAIELAYPGCAATLQALLQNPTLPPPDWLADLFVRELNALPGELILVLDDYNEISAPDVNVFLSRTVQNMPPGVHFILLTRSDPALKVARLRAQQQVLEVRAAQLRFMPDEAQELMQRIIGAHATAEIVTLCAERTEGWAAGLHLAALSLRDSKDVLAFAAAFARSSNQSIVDYLLSEVLEVLPPLERRMLLYTSILPRFCAPLCAAIMPAEMQQLAADDFLKHLRHSNLFLIALDDEGIWFRFHHLFADLLRHRLHLSGDANVVVRLHLAASHWFEANRLTDEAITHALAAGDDTRAAELVEEHIDVLLDDENWRGLAQRLALLPESTKHRPALLIAQGWVQQFRYRPTSILALVEEAEEHLAGWSSSPQVERMRGDLAALRGLAYLFTGQAAQSLAAGQQALPLIPIKRSYVRGLVELFYIRAKAHLGERAAAVAQAQLWLQQQPQHPNARTFRLLLTLCSLYYEAFELEQLQTTSLLYRQIAAQARRPLSVGWTSYLLGWLHYQKNELKLAEQYFGEVVEQPLMVHTRAAIDSWIGLALTQLAQGRVEAAQRQAHHLHRFLVENGLVDLTIFADALLHYLNLLTGNVVQVSERYAQNLPGQLGLDLWLSPAFVLALAQIRQGGHVQLAAAARLLADCRAYYVHISMPWRLLQLEIMEALLHAAAGNRNAVLEALRKLVTACEAQGALRIFVDAGPALKPYLHELAAAGVAPSYIAWILAAFDAGQGSPLLLGAPAAPANGVAQPTGAALLGPDALTNREVDVLVLLERRLSNKEIGALLYISPRTVKRHTINIYQKLHVNNRRTAVAQAKALGLMPAG
ncbi:LuxR C-terminal-related transcriptional regulator [Caldilinea sp.]|uniref:LuxR C-terminal-related transcriptional regulator n=1 Tax=Caldilinea sp. TaxID=2293560 RepID=UPI002C4F7292|nr:LuxR C-terminal-related transcriptional regulator [Caldilinea sp.]